MAWWHIELEREVPYAVCVEKQLKQWNTHYYCVTMHKKLGR